MNKQTVVFFMSLLVTVSLAFAEEAKKEETPKEEKITESASADIKQDEAKHEEVENVVVITVDGTPVLKSEVVQGLNYSLQRADSVIKEDFDKTLSGIEDYLIDITLVNNAAKAKGVTVSDEELKNEYSAMIQNFNQSEEDFKKSLAERGLNEAKFKETFRMNMIRNKFLEEEIEPQITVADEEVKEFYDSHKNIMLKPENVVVSHILIRSEEEDAKKKEQMEDIRQKILKGENFEKMAKAFSDCPSSKNGGNLGHLTRGQTVPEFEEVAFKLEVGQISEVIRTGFGYHIIKVTEKNPEKLTSLEEAKEGIIAHLKKPKRRDIFQTYMKELREKADIKIYEENQPAFEEIVPEEKRAKKTDEAAEQKDSAEPKEEAKPDAPAEEKAEE
ncbi:MAG: peptidylprolyl isomerase [Candidatus Aureabacteria bacterium]|nr:peptidylprolyl isomerase [Candidatus Auribacterota bacterium]